MTIGLALVRNDAADFESKFSRQFNREVHRQIGREFWEITRAAFGADKPNRPAEWPPLSEKYKKRLRDRSFGTPLVPTLLRSGALLNSIRMSSDNTQAVVWTNSPYAFQHQFGTGRIPARPYFPVRGGGMGFQLTDYAEKRIQDRINRLLSSF